MAFLLFRFDAAVIAGVANMLRRKGRRPPFRTITVL